METLTIPDDLAARLRAAANCRSFDAEVTRVLEEAVAEAGARREADLADQIRAFRASLAMTTSGDEITRLIREDWDSDHGRS